MASETGEIERRHYDILDSIEELPSLPQVLVGISRVANDPAAGAEQLAEMILLDQSLTLRILRIANSAQYAMYAQRITTVSKAVVLLGFESVRSIALGAEMYRLLSNLDQAGEILESFWKDAIATAVTSQELARLMNFPVVEEAFVAGLLHDVGKLIFAQGQPERARVLYRSSLDGARLLKAEVHAFGINHGQIGAELARRWDLPAVIRNCMLNHHNTFDKPPKEEAQRLAFIVSVAKGLNAPLNAEKPDQYRELAGKMARLLRKPVGLIIDVLKTLPRKINEYSEFFDLQVDDLKVYTLWVEEENKRLSQTLRDQQAGRNEQEREQALLTAINQLHSLLLETDDISKVAAKIAETSRQVVGANRVMVCVLHPKNGKLMGAWHAGDVDRQFQEGFVKLFPGEGLLSSVSTQGLPLNVVDSTMPYFKRLMSEDELAILDEPHILAVPAIVGGVPVGVLYLDRSEDDGPFTDDETSRFETLANMIALALKKSS